MPSLSLIKFLYIVITGPIIGYFIARAVVSWSEERYEAQDWIACAAFVALLTIVVQFL